MTREQKHFSQMIELKNPFYRDWPDVRRALEKNFLEFCDCIDVEDEFCENCENLYKKYSHYLDSGIKFPVGTEITNEFIHVEEI